MSQKRASFLGGAGLSTAVGAGDRAECVDGAGEALASEVGEARGVDDIECCEARRERGSDEQLGSQRSPTEDAVLGERASGLVARRRRDRRLSSERGGTSVEAEYGSSD